MRSPRPGDSDVTSQVERLNSSDTKIAFSCVLTAAWDGMDTGNLLHQKAGRPVCLNQRQPAPMGSSYTPITPRLGDLLHADPQAGQRTHAERSRP